MTLLTHCGKALLALDDMEQVVHYLKAEVAFCTAHMLLTAESVVRYSKAACASICNPGSFGLP